MDHTSTTCAQPVELHVPDLSEPSTCADPVAESRWAALDADSAFDAGEFSSRFERSFPCSTRSARCCAR